MYTLRPTARPRAGLGLLILLAPCFAVGGCDASSPAPPAVPADSLSIRDIRVRLAADVPRLRFRATGGVHLLDGETGKTLAEIADEEWYEVAAADGGSLTVGEADLGAKLLHIASPAGSAELSLPRDGQWGLPRLYPGRLAVRATPSGGLFVLNLVDLETYVGSVTASEVAPRFADEAYRAQAVAARTYALYAMLEAEASGATHDVSGGEASQVYSGYRDDAPGRRGREAAEATRAIVATWDDNGRQRVFPTYYSAVCGGVSQSGAIFGKASDLPPLRGGVECDYCSIAPTKSYRWDTVTISLPEAQQRLVGRYSEIASICPLMGVEVAETGAGGRPVRIRLLGAGGRTHDLSAENFRLAMDSRGREVKSTMFDLRMKGSTLIFENGRGFGHGLGLCQWGMEGQARAGRHAGEILAYYYPGVRLTRAY
jgi:stage II sporulation protein D